MSRACARQVEPLAEARDAEHLASCAQCRAEAAALDLLAFDAAEPPAPLDELSRRRTLDALLSAYDAGATGGELVEGAGAPLSRRRYRRVALVAATAAAAAIGLAVLVWRTRPAPDAPRQTSVAARSGGSASGGSASGSSSGGSSSGGRARPSHAPAAIPARLLLADGALRDAAGRALGAGAALPAGRLALTGGGAVLRLSRASLVKLVGGSQLTVVPATAERPPRIVLHRGSLTAHVQPGARRALALTVDTPRGSVRVTGTVFGVDVAAQGAEAARVEVSVLHGSVRVAERDAVRAGQRWRSDGTREALDAAQRARLGRAVTLLDLVGAHNSGQLRIDSEPAGAAVRIDGVLVGRTPLVAALPAGQRTLELSLAGHTPVREFLAVTAAARLSRRYGLAPLPSQAPDKPTPRARAVKVSVEVLRARAQKARAERRWRAAAAAYRQLVQRSPRRAGAARLSLAELELVHLGHPRAALAHFARYLAQHPKGLLAAEALWGKARALRALGRSKAEREALETLVRRFAHAPQVTLARRRLRALPR